MANLYPGVTTSIKEATTQAGAVNLGRVCVIGPTKMGAPYQPVSVDSWNDFVAAFGGLQDGNDFPKLCKRALAYGGKLYVARVAHDTGGGVWEGTAATATITQGLNTIIFTAKSVGEGYNGIVIQIRAAKSRDNTKVDVLETYNGKTNTVYDIKIATDADDAIKLNAGLRYTTAAILPVTMPIGTGTLANGAQNLASIVDADYAGDFNTPTKGLHAFDDLFDTIRVANLVRNNATVDAAFIAYCEQRQDMRAILFVPTDDAGAATDMVDYRNAGGYNSMYATIYAGQLLVSDSLAVGGQSIISVAGDVVGAISRKDFFYGVPASVSGATSGVLLDNLGVGFNLDSPPLRSDADFVCNNGINPIVRTALAAGGATTKKTVIWGNRSLVQDGASQTRFDNVCDLLVYLRYLIFPILKDALFTPNDLKTWYALYGKVKPIMELLEKRSFIRAGEGVNWEWRGDQNARSLDSLTINNKADIDAGIYRAVLVVVPMTLTEQIYVEITHTNSSTVASII